MVQGKEAARREPLQIGCVPRSNHQMIREYKPCCIIISGGCLVAGARRPRVAVGGKETCGMRTHLYCECRDAEHRGWKLVTHSLSWMYYQMVAQPIRCKRRACIRVTSAQHVEATPPPCGPRVDRPRCHPAPPQQRSRRATSPPAGDGVGPCVRQTSQPVGTRTLSRAHSRSGLTRSPCTAALLVLCVGHSRRASTNTANRANTAPCSAKLSTLRLF